MATFDEDRTRLAQSAPIGQLHRDLPIGEMLTVYFSDRSPGHDHAIFCALVPTKQIEKSLGDPAWDLSQGQGLPGAVRYGLSDDAKVEYLRFGNTDGVEPLIFVRGYDGLRDDCLEISEEFRHFHRLYRNKTNDQYIKFDGDGNEEVVVVVESNRIRIRLKEIRRFLAIKEMHLALMFDCREHSEHSLKDLGVPEGGEDFRKELSCWGLHYGDFGGMDSWRGFSRFLGKRLIPPVAKENSGFWGYAKEEPKKYVDFIIGQDADGGEISHTSDPDKLSNFFGANPESPNYLTPVQFKKQVLDKYYQQPSKFSIESGYLRCGGLWGMCMDNHFDDRVAAWLGDLGRDLPHGEQLHWRSYNIPPVGGVSKTYFQRQIMAVATDSDRPEHEFQRQYERLSIACAEMLGWELLLPLTEEDTHFYKAIRVPATDEQKDFDELVLAMTKILVDSLNEKELNKLIPESDRADIKGSISRLERACSTAKVANANGHIEYLRKLQNLRSAGTAHRKGSNYDKIAQEFQVDSQSLRQVFEGTLVKGIRLLEFLEATVRSGSFGGKTAAAAGT